MHSSSTTRPLELLFDLDGTLSDPFTGITGSLRHALVKLGREPIDATELRECIGPPLRESSKRNGIDCGRA